MVLDDGSGRRTCHTSTSNEWMQMIKECELEAGFRAREGNGESPGT